MAEIEQARSGAAKRLVCPVPLCGKACKGRIGLGVHLAKSHTSQERAKVWLDRTTDLLPVIMAVVVSIGYIRLTKQGKQEAEK